MRIRSVWPTAKCKRWTYQRNGRARTRLASCGPSGCSSRRSTAGQIPAYVFRPRSASPEQPAPVLVSIHGGPESQYRPDFSPLVQYYVNELGMAVVYPNVRGSAGYGKTYLKLDNAEQREDSVKDIGALARLDRAGSRSWTPSAWP